jgi:ketopantoate reductase
MPEASVKILVFGAGVIGTLYAARLQEGGHRVTVVARGERLADIRVMVWRLKTSLVMVD